MQIAGEIAHRRMLASLRDADRFWDGTGGVARRLALPPATDPLSLREIKTRMSPNGIGEDERKPHRRGGGDCSKLGSP